MFSSNLLCYRVLRGRVLPAYLDAQHLGIVRDVIGIYDAMTGLTRKDLKRALSESAKLSGVPPRLFAGLCKVIEESARFEVASPVAPPSLRDRAFSMAAGSRMQPAEVLQAAAKALGLPDTIPVPKLSEMLFADTHLERRLHLTGPLPGAQEILSRYNFRLVQGFFLCASRIQVELADNVRPVYRFARLHGLLIELKSIANAGGEPGRQVLEITGPLSILKQTRKYGYALARFLPACCVSRGYRLEAELILNGERRRLEVTHADRLISSHALPREFDSKTEQQLYKDFLRLGSRWEISRETRILRAGTSIIFPDFTFEWRGCPSVRVDLEVVGFWTREYLARKLRVLAEVPDTRLIVCIDEKLSCDGQAPRLPCIRYRGRVPAQRVLEELERLRKEGPTGCDKATSVQGTS